MSKPAVKKKATVTHTRSPSASEIARNISNFETWSSYQGCEQVSYSDLPVEIKADVDRVFDVSGKLPLVWVDKESDQCLSEQSLATKEVVEFIQDAYKSFPDIFSNNVPSEKHAKLYSEVTVVHMAWSRLQRMRKSREKWSEADFVANVYNVFRSPGVHESAYRTQCTISLPKPVVSVEPGSPALRILNTRTIIPDCALFLPVHLSRPLSQTQESAYKVLKADPAIAKTGSPAGRSSFRYQATPCTQLPEAPGFEFTSSIWEDKKPVHHMLEDAYRQNRMATTSAVRHLHCLHIEAPVFGLVWANGTVRAHVDWCKNAQGQKPSILSAPYSGSRTEDAPDVFHEWLLDRPADILQVYFLIRNIDQWTIGEFYTRVQRGIDSLVNAAKSCEPFKPWKRDATAALRSKAALKENIDLSTTTSSSSPNTTPPVRTKHKRRKRVSQS